jgi:hypothetical protein
MVDAGSYRYSVYPAVYAYRQRTEVDRELSRAGVTKSSSRTSRASTALASMFSLSHGVRFSGRFNVDGRRCEALGLSSHSAVPRPWTGIDARSAK